MSRQITFIFPLVIAIFAIACLSCDDYNIVEPRFFDEDSLVVFGDCETDPYVDPDSVAINLTVVVAKQEVPDRYGVDACWFDRAEGVLAVFIAMPTSGSYTISLLNSGGGVETVIHEGDAEAGYLVFPCTVDEDGVYALMLKTEPITVVVWFEVK